MSAPKTNAVRLLERLGVPFELRAYEVDPDDLAAETVARKIGLPAEQTFKTLVARGDRHGVCLAVIPGNAQLDPKALARATGDKKVDTVPLKEVEPLTGYVRGGVTALAGKKDYPVYLDETAELFDRISISFRIPGEDSSANLGPPDVLFFALFLATAERFGLRAGWTWIGMTGLLALTLVLTASFDVAGLPALPAICVGFLLPNLDLLWRRARSRSAPADSAW